MRDVAKQRRKTALRFRVLRRQMREVENMLHRLADKYREKMNRK